MTFRCVFWASLVVLFVGSQSNAASLTPPPQTYVLECGIGTQIKFPSSPTLNLTPHYTIEMWIMRETDHIGGPFLGMTIDDTGVPVYQFSFDSSGSGQLMYQQTGDSLNSTPTILSPNPLPIHTWTHVAASSDGTTIRLWVDGTNVAEAASLGPPPISNSTPLELGSRGSFDFSIRQLRIWNVVLSPIQIASYASARLRGNETGLAADWEFDGGNGSTAADRGPNHIILPITTVASPTYTPSSRWIHTAVLDAGPYFVFSGHQSVPSLGTPPAESLGLSTLIDFNGDGVLDAIAWTLNYGDANSARPLVALQNDGLGHFTDVSATTFSPSRPETYAVGAFALGDFNGDQRQDLYIAETGEGRLPEWGAQDLLLLQQPGGGLQDATTSTLPQVRGLSYDAYAADFRHLGIQDVVVFNKGGGDPNIGPEYYVNNGTGHFVADNSRWPANIYSTPSNVSDFAVGDLNGDGSPDVVIGTNFNPPEELLLNDGSGHFTFAKTSSFPANNLQPQTGYDRIFTGDLNGDGRSDVIGDLCGPLPQTNGNCSLRMLLSNPDGTYRDASDQIPTNSAWQIAYDALTRMYLVDMNGDGRLDILVESYPPLLYLNTGDGHFVDAAETLPIDANSDISSYPGDLDRSGRTSIFSSGANGNTYSVSLNVKNFTNFDLLKPLRIVAPVTSPRPAPVHRRGH